METRDDLLFDFDSAAKADLEQHIDPGNMASCWRQAVVCGQYGYTTGAA
jgi:hypothetical protein